MENNNLKKIVWGYSRNLYEAGQKALATEKILLFYDDDTTEIIDLSDLSNEEKAHIIKQTNEAIINAKLEDEQKKFCYTDGKIFQNALKEIEILENKMEVSSGNEPVDEEKKSKVIPTWAKIATAGVGGVALGAAIAAGANALSNHSSDEAINTNNTDKLEDDITAEQETGYGLYHYDLSTMSGMEQYNNEIPDSLQKETSNRLFKVLQEFNQQFQLVDSDEMQLGGFTIEQAIALDAYVNSNVYSSEDYIKNYGLYDFSNITSDFQKATLQAGAYLANPEIDGAALADVFQDETVKNLYLKSLDYRNQILHAEDSKTRKKIVKEYEEFLASQTDTTSENFVDYSEHPGMAFVTPAIVMAFNYHNISLNSEVVSDMLIIGNDGSLSDVNYLSKVDTICPKAETKINDVISLIKDVEHAMVATNQTIKAYNAAETEKAQSENRMPKLLQLEYSELDELISNTLCDQNQINHLINQELEKTNQCVTEQDQEIVMENATKFARVLQEKGQGKYKDEKTAKLAEQLQNPGDTVKVTQEDVKIDTPAEKEKLEEAVPEKVEQAKEELNKSEGLIPNETPEEKKAVEEQIQKDVAAAEQEGVNYYNTVVSYYENHGDVAGIPAELQNAYNQLGADTFGLAKQTGIARFMTKDQNKTFGGENTPAPGLKNGDVDINANASDNQNMQSSSESVQSTSESTQPTPEQTQPVPEQTQPTPEQTQSVPEQAQPAPDQVIPSESENPVPPASENGSVSEFGGEIEINPEFEDVDLGDVSTDPNPTNLEESINVGGVVEESASDITPEMISAYLDSMSIEDFESLVNGGTTPIEDENTTGYTK